MDDIKKVSGGLLTTGALSLGALLFGGAALFCIIDVIGDFNGDGVGLPQHYVKWIFWPYYCAVNCPPNP